MFNHTEIPPENKQFPVESTDFQPKPYLKPYLEELGDLRNLTLGGSPGPLDSCGECGEDWPTP
jgi:hypothetical protein